MPAPPQDLPVTRVSDIYPGIDPKPYFDGQTYAGKSVLITGASRGIGAEISLFYARAGASVSLVARKKETLEGVKQKILSEVPNAKVVTFAANVTDTEAVKAAVEGTVKEFGRLDIAIANAGTADPFDKPFTQKDPNDWWNIVEVNIRGVYNVAHFAIPHIETAGGGYVILVGSSAAQMLLPFASAYVLSKSAVNRLAEYVKAEHPTIKVFSVHPGSVLTETAKANPEHIPYLIDTPQLAAASSLKLTSGKLDWLNGRFVSVNWNLDEVEKDWKEKIIESDSLVNRLHVPV